MKDFSIGRTFSRAFQLIGNSFGGAGLFLLIAYALNTAVSALIQPMMVEDMVQSIDPANPAAAGLGIFSSVWYWLTALIGLAFMGLMYAGSIHGLLRAADGKAASLGECFSVGLTKLLPMAGLLVLWFIAIGFGLVLLIVPGLILITVWAVVMPVLIGEGRGVFETFGRSRELTRGERLGVFLLLIMLIVVIYVIMFVLVGSLLGGAVFTGRLTPEMLGNTFNPVVLIGTAVLGWASTLLTVATIVSIYIELLGIKGGGSTGELDQVFG
jgi:hypothetical protein